MFPSTWISVSVCIKKGGFIYKRAAHALAFSSSNIVVKILRIAPSVLRMAFRTATSEAVFFFVVTLSYQQTTQVNEYDDEYYVDDNDNDDNDE
jgi:hypothetical protein